MISKRCAHNNVVVYFHVRTTCFVHFLFPRTSNFNEVFCLRRIHYLTRHEAVKAVLVLIMLEDLVLLLQDGG